MGKAINRTKLSNVCGHASSQTNWLSPSMALNRIATKFKMLPTDLTCAAHGQSP